MEHDVFPPNQAVDLPDAQQPQAPPKPTYAPFLLALGVTMAFWGLATSPVISAAGFLVFAAALWLWIRDIAQAWRN